jgi:hypothetical protein
MRYYLSAKICIFAENYLIMKMFVVMLICCLSVFSSQAQIDDESQQLFHTRFGLNAGTSFFAGSGFSGTSLFLQPSLSRPLTKRFSLEAGTVFQSHTLFAGKNNEFLSFSPASSVSFYALGALDMSEKITLYGGFLYTEPLLTGSESVIFKPGKAFFGGIDYKINNHSTVGIRVSYSRDNFPYLFSPSPFSDRQAGFMYPSNNFMW